MQSKLSKLQKQIIINLFPQKGWTKRNSIGAIIAKEKGKYIKEWKYGHSIEKDFYVTFHNSLNSLIKRGLVVGDSQSWAKERMTHIKLTNEGIDTAKELMKKVPPSN